MRRHQRFYGRDEARPDYARASSYMRRHAERYRAFVKVSGLPCQECGGRGEFGGYSMEFGPPDPCGFCETTGLVTPHMRGQWLRWKRDEKRAKRAA